MFLRTYAVPAIISVVQAHSSGFEQSRIVYHRLEKLSLVHMYYRLSQSQSGGRNGQSIG